MSIKKKIFDRHISYRPGRVTANQHIFNPLMPALQIPNSLGDKLSHWDFQIAPRKLSPWKYAPQEKRPPVKCPPEKLLPEKLFY